MSRRHPAPRPDAAPAPRVPVTDLAWRPAAYFGLDDPQAALLGRVKGVARREALRELLDAGRLDAIPDELSRAALPEADRQAAGRVHPWFMGGEYLPTVAQREVEIARVRLASTTFDVTSLYARPGASRIRYRVVDEYDGETLSGPTERTSVRPLTLGAMVDFFLGAWDLFDVLEGNYDDDVESMLAFFTGESEFYPAFDATLRARVLERFGTVESRDASD